MSEETKVTFTLWAVLGFIVLMGTISFGFLYEAQGKLQTIITDSKDARIAKDNEITQRIIANEKNTEFIISAITSLREEQKEFKQEMKQALINHERNTVEAIRKNRILHEPK